MQLQENEAMCPKCKEWTSADEPCCGSVLTNDEVWQRLKIAHEDFRIFLNEIGVRHD